MANKITASGKANIAELRIMTNYKAGILDCRKALKESSGNINKAILWLENNNIIEAAKNMFRPLPGINRPSSLQKAIERLKSGDYKDKPFSKIVEICCGWPEEDLEI